MESNPKKYLSKDEAVEIFLRHIGLIRSVAIRHMPVKSIIDDVVQESFIHFVENVNQWEYDEMKIKGLLKMITINAARLQWQRHIKHLPETVQKIWERAGREMDRLQLSEASSHDEIIYILQACLEKLPPDSRELIELYYYENAEYSEVIARAGKSPGAVYTLMSRIRSILHECIEKSLGKNEGING